MILLLAWTAHAEPSALGGRYLLAQDREQLAQTIAAAVDKSAASVTWVFRGIAKPRLTEQATACPGYRIEVAPPKFRTHCDGRDPFEWTIGTEGPWKNEKGETLNVKLSGGGRSYLLDIFTEQGGKRWTYTFQEAGGLTVHQEVYSPYLGIPLAYDLTYKLEAPAP